MIGLKVLQLLGLAAGPADGDIGSQSLYVLFPTSI